MARMNRDWRDIRQALAESVLIGDGAFGTQLHAAGLGPGDCAEEWNASRPDVVLGVTAAYVRAGSTVVSTNTFGGSALKLAAYGLAGRCEEFNEHAASLARQAADGGQGHLIVGLPGDARADLTPPAFGPSPSPPAERGCRSAATAGVRLSADTRHTAASEREATLCDGAFVVGSVGPCGKILEPFGDTTGDEARESFARQVRGLMAGGIDGVLVETMFSLEEALAALAAAAEVAPGLPTFCTMTFQPEGRTSFGVSVDNAVAVLEAAGVAGVGINCGTGSEQALPMVERFCELASVPVIVQPNAGVPKLVAGKAVFDETPEVMAAQALRFRDAGARWIGGCCGSTPAHIRAMAEVLRGGS
jgi:methionine synthase I (cobalamin-dependent)